jgi:hypothetical protein
MALGRQWVSLKLAPPIYREHDDDNDNNRDKQDQPMPN